MKTIYLFAACLFSLSVQAQQNLKGAYKSKVDNEVIICLMDGYFVETKYNIDTKTFNYTWGGPFVKEGNKLLITIHFDSRDKAAVGKTKEVAFGVNEAGEEVSEFLITWSFKSKLIS